MAAQITLACFFETDLCPVRWTLGNGPEKRGLVGRRGEETRSGSSLTQKTHRHNLFFTLASSLFQRLSVCSDETRVSTEKEEASAPSKALLPASSPNISVPSPVVEIRYSCYQEDACRSLPLSFSQLHIQSSARTYSHIRGPYAELGTAGLDVLSSAIGPLFVLIGTLVPSPGSVDMAGRVRANRRSLVNGWDAAGAKPEDVVSPMRVIVSV